jgi:hypothetical protein
VSSDLAFLNGIEPHHLLFFPVRLIQIFGVKNTFTDPDIVVFRDKYISVDFEADLGRKKKETLGVID